MLQYSKHHGDLAHNCGAINPSGEVLIPAMLCIHLQQDGLGPITLRNIQNMVAAFVFILFFPHQFRGKELYQPVNVHFFDLRGATLRSFEFSDDQVQALNAVVFFFSCDGRNPMQ